MNTTPRTSPLLIVAAILAGAQILTSTLAMSQEVTAAPGVRLGLLISITTIAAIQGGIAFYTRGVVVPTADVVEVKTPSGVIVAGEGSELATGTAIRRTGDLDPATAKTLPA